jgi:mRNA interferase HigB
MRIIAKRTLRQFWEEAPARAMARTPIEDWRSRVRAASWSTPAELKAEFGGASILKDGRAVFNIGGNRFRLVVRINYHFQIVYVRYVGTHRQYDQIDAQTI